MSNLNVVAVVPARSGSKGIPDKNLQLIQNRSLLNWATQASMKSQLISRTIVSTDSIEYSRLAANYGAEAPFIRPSSISNDMSGDLGFVLHLIDFLKKTSTVPDMLVHLRPTTPLRNPEILDIAIEEASKLIGKVTAIRSVQKMSESSYKTFEVSGDRNLCTVFKRKKNIEKSNSARQKFPDTYVANGYIDILYPSLILKSGKLHGKQVRAFETEPTIEVDSYFELDLIRLKVSNNPTHFRQLFGDKLE